MLENDFVFAEKTMKYQSTLKKIVTAAGELALRMQAEIDPERVDTVIEADGGQMLIVQSDVLPIRA